MKNELTIKRITMYLLAVLAVCVLVGVVKSSRLVIQPSAVLAQPEFEAEDRDEMSPLAMEKEQVFLGEAKTVDADEPESEANEQWELALEEDRWKDFEEDEEQEIETRTVFDVMFGEDAPDVMKFISDMNIVIRLPEGLKKVSLEQDMLTCTLKLTVPLDAALSITPDDIYRINKEIAFKGTCTGMENDFVNEMILTLDEEKNLATVAMKLNGWFVANGRVHGEYYIVTLREPGSVYDKIVVIDAGHGGKDPGAVAYDKKTWEDDINLAVVLKLKELLDADPDIMAFYTRTDDTYPSLDERVNLANGVNADMFISIHCNSYSSKKLKGTEVLYNRNQGTDDSFNSKKLADILGKSVSGALGTNYRGLYTADDIKIVRLSENPVALVEICYLSNDKDFAKINCEEGQSQTAEAIYSAILEAFDAKENP